MVWLGRIIVAIYNFLFSGAEERASIRRQESFERRIREELGDLMNDPAVLLESDRTASHPRPFGYVTATLQIASNELVFTDGRGELELTYASEGIPGRETVWRGTYETRRDEDRYACLYRCCLYIRDNSDIFKLGRRPS